MPNLRSHHFSFCIIQIYVPTGDHSDGDIDSFYDQLDDTKRQAGSQDILWVMGDLNAKIGHGAEGRVAGPFGLGEE